MMLFIANRHNYFANFTWLKKSIQMKDKVYRLIKKR